MLPQVRVLLAELGDEPRGLGGVAVADAPAAKIASTTEVVKSVAADVVAALPGRPRMRGWLHAAAVPLVLAAGLVLVPVARGGAPRVGAAVFVACAVVLFSVSATNHRGGWGPRTHVLLVRLDHACIFLLIAGTYTPFALLVDGWARPALLAVAWGGAAIGIAFRLLWPTAPRWVCTPLYIALGWAAVPFGPAIAHNAGLAVMLLVALGGLLYTVGGVVYGLRRPNPFPTHFGFHEVFHALTVLAFAAHFAGVTIATAAVT
jgi:hemolysin III